MDYFVNNYQIEINKEAKDIAIARRRRMLGYSQAVLAQKAGISLRTLQQYESRVRDINKASVQTIWMLARALQCTMEELIDIHIDDITDCIRHRESGDNYITNYEIITRKISPAESKADKKSGWKFNWSEIQKAGYEIAELYTVCNNTIQGRISFKRMEGYFFVDHIENAPTNVGSAGEYEGVGANLFAIVCLLSKQAGCEGYVTFISKTIPKVINNYIDKLHAKQIGNSQIMVIDKTAAEYLITKYQLEE